MPIRVPASAAARMPATGPDSSRWIGALAARSNEATPPPERTAYSRPVMPASRTLVASAPRYRATTGFT